VTVGLLKKKFADYSISFSDEGYWRPQRTSCLPPHLLSLALCVCSAYRLQSVPYFLIPLCIIFFAFVLIWFVISRSLCSAPGKTGRK
jgi:hypothetical protein